MRRGPYYTDNAVPRVAHIFALAGVLSVSTRVCHSESIPAHAIPAPERKLVIFLKSDSVLAPGASMQMKQELGALLQPAAIRVEWKDPAADRGGSENDYVAVVHLRGSCRPTEPGTRFQHSVSGPFTLASSAVADGVILPFGDIDCAALNSFFGPSLWRTPDKEREFVYARALARLMAHELYHVIAQTHSHSQSGLAEPAVTVTELLSDHFEFTESALTELYPEVTEYSGRNDSDEVSGK